jgi:hypothetical protein
MVMVVTHFLSKPIWEKNLPFFSLVFGGMGLNPLPAGGESRV